MVSTRCLGEEGFEGLGIVDSSAAKNKCTAFLPILGKCPEFKESVISCVYIYLRKTSKWHLLHKVSAGYCKTMYICTVQFLPQEVCHAVRM